VIVLVRISSLFSFLITVIPPFLGTTWIGLTHALSEIGQIMLALSNFKISFVTTSCMLGFNLVWCSIEGLWSSSIKIRCINKEGWNSSWVIKGVSYGFTILPKYSKQRIYLGCIKFAFIITGYVDFVWEIHTSRMKGEVWILPRELSPHRMRTYFHLIMSLP